jgi:hypothetical protein
VGIKTYVSKMHLDLLLKRLMKPEMVETEKSRGVTPASE